MMKPAGSYTIKVEACVAGRTPEAVYAAVQAAVAGGATTVELCHDLSCGGLTPHTAQICRAREALGDQKGLLVMIRPRKGNFIYNAQEIKQMCDQIKEAATAGADGVVFGVLQGRRLDDAALKPLMQVARAFALTTTFHRAFDEIEHPREALEILIHQGVDRILVSGMRWAQTAPFSVRLQRLRELIEGAEKRIEMVIGGGITPENVADFLGALPIALGLVSVHAHSSLVQNGTLHRDRVAQLVQQANAIWTQDD